MYKVQLYFKNAVFVLALSLTILELSSCAGQKACAGEDNLGKDTLCFAATVVPFGEGIAFPNPVNAGSTLYLKMKIAAVNTSFTPLTATVTTAVINMLGQVVGIYSTSVVSSAYYQNVPILTNITLASGTYSLEVNVDFGLCGNKKICMTDNRRIVVN